MGTLFDQKPRDDKKADLDNFLSKVTTLAIKHKVAVSDVIAASAALELKRKNDLYVDDGDAFDEQIGGIGKLLQDLCSAVEGLKENG